MILNRNFGVKGAIQFHQNQFFKAYKILKK